MIFVLHFEDQEDCWCITSLWIECWRIKLIRVCDSEQTWCRARFDKWLSVFGFGHFYHITAAFYRSFFNFNMSLIQSFFRPSHMLQFQLLNLRYLFGDLNFGNIRVFCFAILGHNALRTLETKSVLNNICLFVCLLAHFVHLFVLSNNLISVRFVLDPGPFLGTWVHRSAPCAHRFTPLFTFVSSLRQPVYLPACFWEAGL